MTANDNVLLPEHLADLARSGITLETAKANGIRSMDDAREIGRRLAWKGPAKTLGSVLAFPYYTPDRKFREYLRIKPTTPRSDKTTGRPFKYEAPIGSSPLLYFPDGLTLETLADHTVPILFVEGEKKAVALAQAGFTVVAVSGVWSWCKKGEADGRPKELIPDFDLIALDSRRVTIVFDSDVATNERVRWAEYYFAETLTRAKQADVRAVRLPDGADEDNPAAERPKVGADEFLVAHGADGLKALIDAATAPVKPSSETTYLHTDVGNGKRFRDWLNGRARYAGDRGIWMVYSGRVWDVDTNKVLIESLAKGFLKWWAGKAADRIGAAAKLLANATTKDEEKAAKGEQDAAKAELTFVIKTQDLRNLRRMIDAARSEYGVLVTTYAETFDGESTEHLLNFHNGTVDLRSGGLRAHDRNDFITKVIPLKFDAGAECPLYLRTLNAIFGGNTNLANYVRRFFGICATADVTTQTLHIFFGTGANGKSTLLELMFHLFGDYAAKLPEQVLLKDKHGSRHPAEKVVLAGLRLAATSETDQSGRLDESRVKELTGADSISARGMRENFFSFLPTHKLIVATNHKPRIVGTDHGIWRRIRLVPFYVRFWKEEDAVAGPHEMYDPNLKADPGLLGRLKAEAAGIMADVVKEAAEFYKSGKLLTPPKEVVLATKEYRESEDVLAQFFDEMVDVGTKPFAVKTGDSVEWFIPTDEKDNWIKASVLYGSYKDWCEGMNLNPAGSRTFGEYAQSVLGEPKRSNGKWYFAKMRGETWPKVERWNGGTDSPGSSESKKTTPQGANPGNDFHHSTVPPNRQEDQPFFVGSDDRAWGAA